jgi:hypothetical protein
MNELQEKIESKIKNTMSVSYYNNPQNNRIVKAFLEFVDLESDGGRLQGIKQLLTSYSVDWKYVELFEEIQRLKVRVNSLEQPNKKSVVEEKEVNKREVKVFGRKMKENE